VGLVTNPGVQLRHVHAPNIRHPLGAERWKNVYPQRPLVFLTRATFPLRLDVKR
jgi:hypothetical protein